MSRTRRCKNNYYPGTWGGQSYAPGYFIYGRDGWRLTREWVRADPTNRKEYGKALHDRHKESSTANERTPGHWYRRRRETEYRRSAQHQIHRFMMDPEHEVVIDRKPKSHLWDWR